MKRHICYILSNPDITLKEESVGTHIYIKQLLLEGSINIETDIIVTMRGREFLYNNIFHNVISWTQFQNKKYINYDIVDLTTNYTKWRSEKFLWGDINFELLELIKNIKVVDTTKLHNGQDYICIGFRTSTKKPLLNSNAEWTRKFIHSIRNYYDKIFITGLGSQQFIEDGVTTVNLQEWTSLINNDKCQAVVTSMSGLSQLVRLYSNTKKVIEIDYQNIDISNNRHNVFLMGLKTYPSKSEFVTLASHAAYEHVKKIISPGGIVKTSKVKYLNIGIVNSAARTGLGDNLVYSIIPRLAKEQGYEKVFISELNKPRHESINDLVWKSNSYVDNWINQKADLKNSLEHILNDEDYSKNHSKNLINMIADSYDLKYDGLLSPEIYYQPKNLSEFKNALIWDPNFVTSSHNITTQKVIDWVESNNISFDYQISSLNESALVLPDRFFKKGTIKTIDIFNYVDILHSAKMTFMLLSGGTILSAAINKKSTCLFSNSRDIGFSKWMFKPNEYIYLP